jgi:hypothetical protein
MAYHERAEEARQKRIQRSARKKQQQELAEQEQKEECRRMQQLKTKHRKSVSLLTGQTFGKLDVKTAALIIVKSVKIWQHRRAEKIRRKTEWKGRISTMMERAVEELADVQTNQLTVETPHRMHRSASVHSGNLLVKIPTKGIGLRKAGGTLCRVSVYHKSSDTNGTVTVALHPYKTLNPSAVLELQLETATMGYIGTEAEIAQRVFENIVENAETAAIPHHALDPLDGCV